MAAVDDALCRGTSFGAPTVAETELAELVCQLVPSVEKVRMVNSGTEATMSAVRLARGHTKRDVVVKFAGCYHGHVDSLLVQAGSGALTLGVPSSPGVPAGCTQDTLSLEFNDSDQLAAAFASQGDKIACVILEPVVGNMGVVPPLPGFLETARALCSKHGALLIFDEVMTGFRVAPGGAQQLFGVTPDLTTMGKVLGGGLPVGAYGGSEHLMRQIAPDGPVYQAGTLSGNPLATAAGIATLTHLREHPEVYEHIERLGEMMDRGWSALARDEGYPLTWNRVGSMGSVFFTTQPVVDWNSAAAANRDAFTQYFWGMLERGIYLAPSPFEVLFLSAAHTEADIDRTLDAARDVLAEVFSS